MYCVLDYALLFVMRVVCISLSCVGICVVIIYVSCAGIRL